MQWNASCKHDELKYSADEVEENQDVEKGVPTGRLEQSKDGKQDSLPVPANSHCCDIGTAGFLTLIREFPHLLIAPVILFCLIVALCTFGIVHATKASYELEGQQARDAALSAADGLVKQLSSASRAALSLAAVVKMNPNWSFLESNFHALAEELFRQSNEDGNDDGSLALMELTLLPFGRVRASLGKPIQRNSSVDLFSSEYADEYNTLEIVKEYPGLHIQGPLSLTNSEDIAFTAGYPIFFPDTNEDESWGHPDNITHPTGCPGPPCYDPKTRKKYWGAAGALVNAGPILAGNNVHLDRLLLNDLSYMLEVSRPDGTSGTSTFVSGGPHPDKVTATVPVALPGTSWVLSVYNPRQEEALKLRDGLLAMVLVMAFVLSGLLLLLLLSSKRASVLLQEQLVTNKLLQEEKVSREALLGRQLDLIACFEQNTKRTKDDSRFKLSGGQLNTLEQITKAKAAISDVATRKDEDIQVQELLAEGGFGKVYRGKWRGTDVAVKIILLPGNMSGREKREKMIVWEAAISSSLVHPNVCQTYHYRIKPVKESSRSVSEKANASCAVASSDKSSGICETSGPEEVHSYEVQLVLEYCDRGSLRDALDAGLFMTPRGINYAAQLDCAMDVAKAMLHLHCNNVLHLDLKTHNILLASSAEGKGVTCKVSDFGLSVRMDLSATHVSSLFQGTLTHMSPEVLLKGTCSKASDVYAFGIVLWELYTGGSPFRNVPPMLLGHSIVKDGKRPTWPALVPKGYKDLTEACWDQNPDARPTFEAILEELHKLRKELGIPTAPLQPYPVKQPRGRLPHFQETFASLSQPSLTMLQTRDSRDFLQAKGPSTPSQAALLEQAWLQRRGNGGAHQTKGPLTPSQAALLEQAWLQERGNGSAPQAKGPLTPSQAALLEQAWQQPRGNGSAPQIEGSSTPSQAAPLHPKGSSDPSPALSDTSTIVLRLTNPQGTLSASLRKEGKENTGSTDPVHEKSGQEGLNHPQSGAWEGGLERSCTSNTPTPSVPGSLATSPLSTTPGQLSLGPGACSVKPKNDPHAVGEDAGEVQPVCGAGGRSEGQKKEHEVSFGEGDAAPTFDKPQQ